LVFKTKFELINFVPIILFCCPDTFFELIAMLAIDELKSLQVFRNITKNTFFFWEDLEKAVIILFVKSQYNNSRFLFEALTVK
jgi:hypothetical protein